MIEKHHSGYLSRPHVYVVAGISRRILVRPIEIATTVAEELRRLHSSQFHLEMFLQDRCQGGKSLFHVSLLIRRYRHLIGPSAPLIGYVGTTHVAYGGRPCPPPEHFISELPAERHVQKTSYKIQL